MLLRIDPASFAIPAWRGHREDRSRASERQPERLANGQIARNFRKRYASCVAFKHVGRLGNHGSGSWPRGQRASEGYSQSLRLFEEHTEDVMADQRRRARTRPDQQPPDSHNPPAELTADDISARIAERLADLQKARDEFEEAKLVTHHTMEFEVCR